MHLPLPSPPSLLTTMEHPRRQHCSIIFPFFHHTYRKWSPTLPPPRSYHTPYRCLLLYPYCTLVSHNKHHQPTHIIISSLFPSRPPHMPPPPTSATHTKHYHSFSIPLHTHWPLPLPWRSHVFVIKPRHATCYCNALSLPQHSRHRPTTAAPPRQHPQPAAVQWAHYAFWAFYIILVSLSFHVQNNGMYVKINVGKIEISRKKAKGNNKWVNIN